MYLLAEYTRDIPNPKLCVTVRYVRARERESVCVCVYVYVYVYVYIVCIDTCEYTVVVNVLAIVSPITHNNHLSKLNQQVTFPFWPICHFLSSIPAMYIAKIQLPSIWSKVKSNRLVDV